MSEPADDLSGNAPEDADLMRPPPVVLPRPVPVSPEMREHIRAAFNFAQAAGLHIELFHPLQHMGCVGAVEATAGVILACLEDPVRLWAMVEGVDRSCFAAWLHWQQVGGCMGLTTKGRKCQSYVEAHGSVSEFQIGVSDRCHQHRQHVGKTKLSEEELERYERIS